MALDVVGSGGHEEWRYVKLIQIVYIHPLQTAVNDAADVLGLLEFDFSQRSYPAIPFAGMKNRSFWVR